MCVRSAAGAVERYELVGSLNVALRGAGPALEGRMVKLQGTMVDPKLVVIALGLGGADPGIHAAAASASVLLPCSISETDEPRPVLKYTVCPTKPVQLVRFKSQLAFKAATPTAAVPSLFAIAKLTLQVPLSTALVHFDMETAAVKVQVSLSPLTAGGTNGIGIGELKLQPTHGGNYSADDRILQWVFKPAGKPLPPVLEYQALIQLTSVATTAAEVPKSPVSLPGIVKLSLEKSLLSQVSFDLGGIADEDSLTVALVQQPVLTQCRAEYKFL